MYYKNTANLKQINYRLLSINDFSENFNYDNELTNTKTAKLCVNFCTNSNQLTKSYGDEKFNCYTGVDTDNCVYPEIANINNILDLKFFVSNQNKISKPLKQLMVVTSDYKIYMTVLDDSSTNYFEIMDLPKNCNYKILDYCYQNTNYMIITTKVVENNVNYIYTGHGEPATEIGGEFFIHDICNHNEKMFLVLDEDCRNKILFGSDLNPYNIESSVINMESIRIPASKGKILKLVSLGDYLYVVCEFGIFRMVSYSGQKKHYLEEVYSGNAKIAVDSIVVGGECIIFADEQGVYSFNGNSVEKIELGFDEFFRSTKKHFSVACFNNNKYYLSARLNYLDGIVDNYDYFVNNALIVYDVLSKKIELCCDISIKKMICYQDGYSSRIAILSGSQGVTKLKTLSNTGLYYGKVSKKIWQSHIYNFNKPESRKIVRYFHIKTRENISLSIISEGKEFIYDVAGSDSVQKITVNVKLKDFSIKIVSSSANPCIESIKFLVGIYE